MNKKVSICMITYNHEKFIKEAIEGVLNQQTNFEFELIIGDDFSTDSTLQICEEYQEKYPQIIKLLFSTKNLGMMPNFVRTLQACKGEYIALCEGDDYWTDTNKLQKQVDFLDENSNYALCFHRVLLNYVHNPKSNSYSEIIKSTTTLEDLASFNHQQNYIYLDKKIFPKYNYIQTVSCIFRNKIENLPTWFVSLNFGDYPLHLLNAQHGAIYFMEDIMAVYNIHTSSSWSSKKAEFQLTQYFNFLLSIVDKFEDKINTILVENILFFLFYLYYNNTDFFYDLIKNLENKDNLIIKLVKIKLQKDIENQNLLSLLIETIEIREEKQKKEVAYLNLKNSFEYKMGKILLKPYRYAQKMKQKLKFRTRLRKLLK